MCNSQCRSLELCTQCGRSRLCRERQRGSSLGDGYLCASGNGLSGFLRYLIVDGIGTNIGVCRILREVILALLSAILHRSSLRCRHGNTMGIAVVHTLISCSCDFHRGFADGEGIASQCGLVILVAREYSLNRGFTSSN